MLTRRVTFRLYPSDAQAAKMLEVWRLFAYLYNICVEDQKASYQTFGKSVNYLDPQAAIVLLKAMWEAN